MQQHEATTTMSATTMTTTTTSTVCRRAVALLAIAVTGVWTPSAQASPTTPAPPVVVFEPGILGYRSLALLGDYWGEVPNRLRAQGFVVVERAPAPVAAPIARAQELADDVDDILEETGAERVVIIAHSQGGLDVRAALDVIPGFASKVGAVATLSTPHHGSPMADVGFAVPWPLVDTVLGSMHRGFEFNQGVVAHDAAVESCLVALSPAGAATFNVAHPASPVPLFSIGAVSGRDVDDVCSSGIWGAPVVEDVVGPASLWNRAALQIMAGDFSNDGVVPTKSMRFSTFLGCVPADHGDWMGWVSHPFEEELVWSPTPFLVELAHALVDVDRYGERAMQGHLQALAGWARSSSAAPGAPPMTWASSSSSSSSTPLLPSTL